MRNLQNETGYFLFSLDTELAWGHFDCFRPQMFSRDGQRERRAVQWLLDVFDEFNITATWAIVGQLFHERYAARDAYPGLTWLEQYPAFAQLYKSNSPLLYGADIIEYLRKRGARHEIGFHGYTHKVFDENRLSKAEAEAEIQVWLNEAQCKNIAPRTVIFPRNKVGHLDLFQKYGFTCYRGVELTPAFYGLPLLGCGFRRYYYYLAAISTPIVYEGKPARSGLVNLPSSRWLFGFNRKLDRGLDALNLQTLRMYKIVQGIKQAAREKKIIHIWAHPYEFQTPKDIEKLRYLLKHVAEEVKQGRMQSIGMAELAENFTQKE
jgi:hypothetical protein